MKDQASQANKKIAIVGMAVRASRVTSLEEFWHYIEEGKDSLSYFSPEDLRDRGVNRKTLLDARFVPTAAQVEDIDSLDAEFFGLNGFEADRTAPAQRLFLECCFEALEHANIIPGKGDQKIGVYAGSESDYLKRQLDQLGEGDRLQLQLGNSVDFVSTRVSHKLDIHGPSMSVMAACATSLMAVHLGVQSLRNGEADAVLAGGATVHDSTTNGYFSMDDGMLSSSGRIRSFDKEADGTIFGNGVSVVVLRRLEDALADRQPIYGVLLGTGASNDGNPPGKSSFTAPSPEGQMDAVEKALVDAGVNPETIGYVEAHGTATNLGDPIEAESLSRVYRKYTNKVGFCGLGSVKANFGHQRTAAGTSSLIKACNVLENETIPPIANLETPNPKLDIENGPFFLSRKATPWRRSDIPRRVAVSSFGFGGTNVHAILEESPVQEAKRKDPDSREYLCFLSAESPAALKRRTEDLAAHLDEHREIRVDDLAHSLRLGRKPMSYRAVFRTTQAELGQAFRKAPVLPAATPSKPRKSVFLLPGQGSQFVGMGKQLYKTAEKYREVVDFCAQGLKPLIGLDLRELLHSDDPDALDSVNETLGKTANAQPALFVVEYALAMQLMDWGLRPDILFGHSIGEITAACLAEVFSLEDGLEIVAARSRLMQKCEPGAMMVVFTSVPETKPLLPAGVEIATVNAPQLTVVSGPSELIEVLRKKLDGLGLATKLLRTSHAFHSAMMEPALQGFRKLMSRISLKAPKVPVISNITGQPLTQKQATDPAYWADQIRQAVQFSAGAGPLTEDDTHIFMEVGPSHALSELIRQHDGEAMVYSTIGADGSDVDSGGLEEILCKVWQSGAELSAPAYAVEERPSFVELPTYPFQRRRHWIEPGDEETQEEEGLHLYAPDWEKQDLKHVEDEDSQHFYRKWLVLMDKAGVGARVAELLQTFGQTVYSLHPGEEFTELANGVFRVRPNSVEDFSRVFGLVSGATSNETSGLQVVNLWPVSCEEEEHNTVEAYRKQSNLGHNTLIALTQAAFQMGVHEGLGIVIAANGLFKLHDEGDVLHAEKTGLLGPARKIPREMPEVSVKVVDISSVTTGAPEDWAVDAVVAESEAGDGSGCTLYRPDGRYRERLGTLPEITAGKLRLRPGGTVLITGGVGALGLEVAGKLFDRARSKLVLTTRWPIPDEATWAERARVNDKIGRSLARIVDLKNKGAEILLVQTDMAVESDVANACRMARDRFGRIHGVVHTAGATTATLVLEEEPAVSPSMFGKVLGAFHLEKVFENTPLDFMVHFSSQASYDDTRGQAVYGGANNILDALAARRRSRGLGYSIAIGWGPWEKIGMAAAYPALRAETTVPEQDRVKHPLVQGKSKISSSVTVYSGFLHPDQHWIVGAHLLDGKPLLAGVVYVECLRAVAEDIFDSRRGVELREVSYIKPIFVGDSGVTFEIVVTENDGRLFCTFRSVNGKTSKEDAEWTVNCRAEIMPLESRDPASLDVSRFEAAASASAVSKLGENLRLTGTDRWNTNMRAGVIGETRVNYLFVDDAGADWNEFGLYPPLLDQGSVSILATDLQNRGQVVPARIRSVRVHGRMGLDIYVTGQSSGQGNEKVFGHNYYNSQGTLIATYEGFEVRELIGSTILQSAQQSGKSASAASPFTKDTSPFSLKMRSVGDFNSFELAPFDPGNPGPGQIRIRVIAAGLNFRDVLTALGKMPVPGEISQYIGGECSGYVDAIGPGVKGFEIGDPVVAICGGCFGSHTMAAADLAMHIPGNLVMEEAAGIPAVFLTADYALRKLAGLKKGERVLIHAGAGGVGLAAIQMALDLGAEVITTAGHDKKHEYLRHMGVEHVFSSRSLDFAADVLRVTNGEGVDVVLNSLSGKFLHKSLEVLKPYGRFVEIGKNDLLADSNIGLAPFIHNLSFMAFDLNQVTADRPREVGARFERLMQKFARKEYVPNPINICDIEKASEGFELMARAGHIGKIVFKLGEHTGDWQKHARAFRNHFGEGILPREGLALLMKVLSSDEIPPLLIATPSPIKWAQTTYSPSIALSSCKSQRPDLDVPYQAPETTKEKFLASHWEKTMGIEGIGINDDFFDLGGDSIMVIRILFSVFKEYGLRLPTQSMLRHSTIKNLAKEIENHLNHSCDVVLS